MKRKLKGGKARTKRQRERQPLGAPPSKKPESPPQPFPIVGIGASAGGFEAFSSLLDRLPPATGMAFVLVQHLLPKHESALRELLSRHTPMPVLEVTEGMVVRPNHVYVIPPDKKMVISDGVLRLVPRTALGHMPIDFFLQSLAETRQSNAIGVILSGTATDGTLGLKAIKAEGGITFAQDEKSAKYDTMPRSAVASGWVDFVLPPERIAEELARIGSHPFVGPAEAKRASEPVEDTGLQRIFGLLRAKTGVDFSDYKPASIKRRISRRMVLKKIDHLRDYVRHLQDNPPECDALFDDILIHVTSFFRDPGAFEVLKKKVFPSLMKDRNREAPVRMWMPGCSTGEEVYSVVMALLEYLGEDGPSIPIQVFATDISDKAIAKAREGVFRENITPQVSQARLKRFFTKAEGGYQISKSIRELILFAKHDVTKDPPYSRLDLVCCRNLLIFLGPVLQQRVFAAFHWALKPSGYLMLGTAETVGELSDYFRPVDSRYKIYAKRGSYVPLSLDFLSQRALLEEPAEARPREAAAGAPDLQKEADRVAIEHYSPPGVVVDDDMEIVQFRGHTGSYLDPMPGAASLNLLKIARGDLLFELRSATEKAKRSNAPTAKAGIRIQFNGETRVVNVRVVPLKPRPGGRRYFFVFFEESPPPFSSRKAAESKARRGENGRVRRLEQELKAAKEYLRSAMEDQEATNEELRTANEEVLSANEELQTTNEELETAKEELQSTNEELTTLNEELQNRNAELGQMASDLRNVLNSTFAGIVVVGRDLRIRYFTTQAEKVLNLIPADVGRPVRDIRPSLDIPNLEALIAAVIDEVSNKELTVKGPDGSFYSLRLRPYLTVEKKVDGAVISLIDISERKRAEDAIASSEERFRSLVDAIRDYAIMLLDPEGRVVSSNSGVEDVLGYRADEIEGKHLSCFFPNHSRELADQELAATRAHERYEGEALRVRKDGSQFWAGTLTIALRDHVGNLRGFAKVVQDITSRKEEEDLSRELSIRMMRAQDEERKRISRELHDTAGPSLAALVMNLAQVEKAASGLGRKTRSALAESVKLAKECAQQLRTVSYQLHPPLLDEAGLASALRWYVELLAQRSELKAELELPPNLPRLPKEIEFAVFRVVQEALMNVQRHSGSPTAQVKITCDNHRLALEVRDQGKGIPAEVRDGLGLRGMRERVQQAGGAIEIDSDGDGTAVRVSVPLAELPAPVKE